LGLSHLASQLTDRFGFCETFHQPHRSIDRKVAYSAFGSVQIERIPDLTVDTQRKVVTKMFAKGFGFYHLTLTVFHFLKFAIFLDFCLNHPNIQILSLGTQPVGHPLPQLRVVVAK